MPEISERAVFTVVSSSHLAFARALAGMIRENDGTVPLYVCLSDKPPPCVSLEDEPFEVLYAQELGISNWRRLAFIYSPFELCAALKLIVADHLLHVVGLNELLYLDADIVVCAPLAPVFSALDNADVVLTPHLRGPLPLDEHRPSELTIRKAGTFNTGQIALRRSTSVKAMIGWWRTKAHSDCIIDIAGGLFVEQGWLELVPGMFEKVGIDRSPGHNAGYWNFHGRHIASGPQGDLTIDGEPLVTVHFSGFDPEQPTELSRYQDRLKLREHPILERLAKQFADRLMAEGYLECSRWEYGHSRLSDGTLIEPAWREALRTDETALRDILDPFDAECTPNLARRFRAAAASAKPRRIDWIVHDSQHRRPRLRRVVKRIFGPRFG